MGSPGAEALHPAARDAACDLDLFTLGLNKWAEQDAIPAVKDPVWR